MKSVTQSVIVENFHTPKRASPSPAACPTIRQRDGQVTLGFHRHRTGDRAGRRKCCSSCMQLARPRPDFSTAGGASGSADVCSCRAASTALLLHVLQRWGGRRQRRTGARVLLLQDRTRVFGSLREREREVGGKVVQSVSRVWAGVARGGAGCIRHEG